MQSKVIQSKVMQSKGMQAKRRLRLRCSLERSTLKKEDPTKMVGEKKTPQRWRGKRRPHKDGGGKEDPKKMVGEKRSRRKLHLVS